MATLLEALGVGVPVIQAGMGGGIAGRELAASVSAAGGLGTIGFLGPNDLRQELAAARRLTDRPLAVNVLLPFARAAHFHAASEADVVVTFWGEPKRQTPRPWVHQCGSVEEVLAARRAGADAVIVQGVEAGGNVRGTLPALDLLAQTRHAVGEQYPVFSAGGIAAAHEAKTRLEGGAQAVVCGTRFLMSDESGAHPGYKRRLLEARETILTELFGFGWPGPHRVVANQATERWLGSDRRGPRWLRLLHHGTAPALRALPMPLQARLAAMQQPGRPFFGPVPATAGGPRNLVDAGPLYAGQCVQRIDDVRPAAQILRELAP